MEVESTIQRRIEKSRLLCRVSIIIGICAFAMASVVLFSGIVKTWMGSDSYALILIPYILVAILAFSSAVFGFLDSKAAMEEEDRLLLEKRKEKQAFETGEDVLFTSARAFRNFKKYTPLILALINSFIIGFLLFLYWKYWAVRVDIPVPGNPLQAAFVSIMLSILSVFGGVFCIGQSRERAFRWLRPAGAWLILSFILGTLATFAILMQKFDLPSWDFYVARFAFIILAVLGIELLVNLIIEFYRPRISAEERPVFESRILALFTEPGGMVRNIADTLDYQFGFKVSKTWLYIFLEKSLTPLIIVWLAAFWLFTCIGEVGPDEVGVRENFGRRIESKQPLPAGIYLKLPWPFGRIARFPAHKIQEINIGPELIDEKGNKKLPEVILWSTSHYAGEGRFLVAAEREVSGNEVPVSFMAAFLPIQYKIRKDDVVDYAYRHENPDKTLKAIAEREIARYFASADMLKIMSVERGKTIKELTENIQKAADEMELGVEIIKVNLHDAHPPANEVALAFQDVVGAQEERETEVLSSEVYRNKVLPIIEAETKKLIADAETYRDNAVKISEAEKVRFGKQLSAYQQMPEMFVLHTYLDFLENDCKAVRKYIVPVSSRYDVYIINLEEKTRLDLTEVDLGELSEK